MQGNASLMYPNNEGRLWLFSFVIALLICLLGFAAFGVLSIASIPLGRKMITRKVPEEQRLLIVVPPRIKMVDTPRVEPDAAENAPKRFARTSADQNSEVPEKADFIGNKDTVATSDVMPATGAPPLPSLSGKEPLNPNDIETTESSIQDGDLAHNALAQAAPSEMVKSAPAAPSENAAEEQPSPAPAAEEKNAPFEESPKLGADTTTAIEQAVVEAKKMFDGEQIVERELAKEEVKAAEKQADPESAAEEKTAQLPKPKEQEAPQRNDPGFRGNQEKTKLSGSLSRQGRAAMNVANTALGRYHAQLSRAVEAEWSKNCTKYRDFITPGILTLRFVIDEKGEIRSVGVVEMLDAGEVQKGFTLNAIRQAKIPPMPKDLLKELDGEPLELIYNFYF